MENFLENYKLEGQKLKVVTHPAAILKKVATEVKDFDLELQLLCKNMLYTMYNAPGIGLASPQIGISKRIFVIDTEYKREEVEIEEEQFVFKYSNFSPLIVINPLLKNAEGEFVYEEGCLSLPGVYEDVKRCGDVDVMYQDMFGNRHEKHFSELSATCIQHENDHLNGVLFIDKLSLIKKNMAEKKYLKQKKNRSKR